MKKKLYRILCIISFVILNPNSTFAVLTFQEEQDREEEYHRDLSRSDEIYRESRRYMDAIEAQYARLNPDPNATRVLIVGKTGHGKTTVLHALNQIPLHVTPRTIGGRRKRGIDMFKIDAAHETSLESSIGHGKESQTKWPIYVYNKEENILFVDCPGFYDTGTRDFDDSYRFN